MKCLLLFKIFTNFFPPFFSYRKSLNKTRQDSGAHTKSLFTSFAKTSGYLSSDELHYWNDNFKLLNHEAGLTPAKPRRLREKPCSDQRSDLTLSLTEWTAWQTPLQHVHFVSHSKRSRYFAEILEFCDFRRDIGDNEDSYELEMKTFFNSEDVEKPGEEETCHARDHHMIEDEGTKYDEVEVDASYSCHGDEFGKEVTLSKDTNYKRKPKETYDVSTGTIGSKIASRKRKSMDYDLALDDDFEDDVKHAYVDCNSKDQEQSIKKTYSRSIHSQWDHLKSTAGSYDIAHDSCDDLSELFDIPSSQRRNESKNRRRGTIDICHSKVLPDAPSLETLMDLNELNSMTQDTDSDSDFLPSMFMDPSASNKCNDLGEEDDAKSYLGKAAPDFVKFEVEVDTCSKNSDGSHFNEESAQRIFGKNESTICVTNNTTYSKEMKDEGYLSTRKDPGDEKSFDGGSLRNNLARSSSTSDSGVFGSGLVVCNDALLSKKHSENVEFDFHQNLANSFFADDDDEIDRVLSDIKSPCVVDDDNEDCESSKLKNVVKTPCLFDDDDLFDDILVHDLKDMSSTQAPQSRKDDTVVVNSVTSSLFNDNNDDNIVDWKSKNKDNTETQASVFAAVGTAEDQSLSKSKICQLETPRLFDSEDDGVFDKSSSEPSKPPLSRPATSKVLRRKADFPQTPCLFDEEGSEVNEQSRGRKTVQCLLSGQSSLDDKTAKHNDIMKKRRPFVEQNITTHVNIEPVKKTITTSLNKIQLSSCTKSNVHLAKSSMKMAASEGDESDMVYDSDDDVIAPSPERMNGGSELSVSLSGKSLKSSFQKNLSLRSNALKLKPTLGMCNLSEEGPVKSSFKKDVDITMDNEGCRNCKNFEKNVPIADSQGSINDCKNCCEITKTLSLAEEKKRNIGEGCNQTKNCDSGRCLKDLVKEVAIDELANECTKMTTPRRLFNEGKGFS